MTLFLVGIGLTAAYVLLALIFNRIEKAWQKSWHRSNVDRGYQWASRQISLYNEPDDIWKYLCEWNQSTDFGKGNVEALQEHLTGIPRKVIPWYKRFLRALLL